MVSKTPTKPTKPSPKSGSPAEPTSCLLRSHRAGKAKKRQPSPLKALATAPAAVAASLDRSLRSCRRRLFKIFARLAVLGTPHKRGAGGFHRLKSTVHADPSPPPPPPPPVATITLPPPSNPEKKTLFLDLDETLIHSQTDPTPARYDFTVRPVIGGQPITFYVLKRPGVDELLREAAKAFEIVVFTAGLKEYASLVLDQLDPAGEVIAHRLYRSACREVGDGKLVKDLAATGRALDRAVIVDDNPNAYAFQPENAMPVAPFIDDASDQELRRVMKFLEVAAAFDDTREAIRYYNADCAGT